MPTIFADEAGDQAGGSVADNSKNRASPDVDSELANDLLLGPLFTRAVIRGQRLEPELADQTADIVLAALRAGSLRGTHEHAHHHGEQPAPP